MAYAGFEDLCEGGEEAATSETEFQDREYTFPLQE
jgi:hypothetical protein